MAASVLLVLFAATLLADDSPVASQPANRANAVTSQPTTGPDDRLIAQLISELGSSDFRIRNAAQARLKELGATALPSLIKHVNNPSPEIANRVMALVQTPKDAGLRVELAVALLATRRHEPMERAVYMMFDSPEACCELFIDAVPAMTGRDRLVGNAIAEQFRSWRRQFDIFKRQYDKIRPRDADSAERLLAGEIKGRAYHAEAAFQMGLDALETGEGTSGDAPPAQATTRPARAESQPAAP